MSRFLWVEDFSGGDARPITQSLWGSVINEADICESPEELEVKLLSYGIILKRSLSDALDVINDRSNLSFIDYVIIDVNLPISNSSKISDTSRSVINQLIELCGNNQSELVMTAGYHVYIQLVLNQSFPMNHVIIVSDHINELKTLYECFRAAKIPIVETFDKKDNKRVKEANTWIASRYNEKYYRLRTGIQLAVDYVANNIKNDNKYIIINNNIINKYDNIDNDEVICNIDTIRSIMPLQRAHENVYFVLLCNIVRLFDKVSFPAEKQYGSTYTYSMICKTCRNWTAHHVINSRTLISESDIAYLLIMCFRSMFDLSKDKTEPYENYLLRLINHDLSINEKYERLDKNEMRTILCESYKKIHSYCVDNKINCDNSSYYSMIKSIGEKNKTNFNYIEHLYKMFWHLCYYDVSKKTKIQVDNNAIVLSNTGRFELDNSRYINDHNQPLFTNLLKISFSKYLKN